MKLEITHEKLEEMVLCIVRCDLSEQEALDYANAVMLEFNDIESMIIDYETS